MSVMKLEKSKKIDLHVINVSTNRFHYLKGYFIFYFQNIFRLKPVFHNTTLL
jgi:hypothetical protein